jgi:hypothetical protein
MPKANSPASISPTTTHPTPTPLDQLSGVAATSGDGAGGSLVVAVTGGSPESTGGAPVPLLTAGGVVAVVGDVGGGEIGVTGGT